MQICEVQVFQHLYVHFAMHIPDGFLSPAISIISWVLAVGAIAFCLTKVQSVYKDKTVPLMGVCAAFIFAAQMINFPIPNGTSGHLLGGTLAGALLGPWAGSLVMTVVFIVQAVMFQDGGVMALGANVVNMGLVGTFGGYWLYRAVRSLLGNNSWRSMNIAAIVSAWTSVVGASALVAIQLALSDIVPLNIALVAMVSWHIFIGIGEALITSVALSFVWRTRPDLLFDPPLSAASSTTTR